LHETDYSKLILVLDGQYASGFNIPSSLSYGDMEPKYSASLLEYGNKMMMQITNELEKLKKG